MTKLKININFNSNRILSIQDTTGFGGSEGFFLESSSPTGEGNYKLSNGYFVNLVVYHRYNTNSVIVNPNDLPYYIESADVSTTYANNFSTYNYTLAKDGVYSFKRIFVISKAYYLANINTITKEIVYYDPDLNKFINPDLIEGEND